MKLKDLLKVIVPATPEEEPIVETAEDAREVFMRALFRLYQEAEANSKYIGVTRILHEEVLAAFEAYEKSLKEDV